MNAVTFFVQLSASVESFGMWSCEKYGAFMDASDIPVLQVVRSSFVHHYSFIVNNNVPTLSSPQFYSK